MSDQLEAAQQWLAADQYTHGEWGRCESTDPTADLRSLDLSRIKPNLFISAQAALALRATGFRDETATTRFFEWLYALRQHDSGFWTSASGAQVPMGGARGWSEVTNIRHTAKALDMLLLLDQFTAGDAPILHGTLDSQLDDGSFPQHPSGPSDLWSTAYAMNLMIRTGHADRLVKSVPRGSSKDGWGVELRNRLERARSWLCSQASGSLWRMQGRDPFWISEAVLTEVGADLSLHRPDVAAQVAGEIFRTSSPRRGQTYWAMLLGVPRIPWTVAST